MSNKVDRLFKDKLEGHALQPSAQAWEKVEAHLGKKNKMVVWLRVAAVLMLFGVLTFVGLNWNKKEAARQEVAVKKETEVRRQETGVVKEEKKKVEAPKKKVIKKKVEVIEEPAPTPVIIEEQQVAVVIETPQPEPILKKEKGITLTYSLPAIKKEEPIIAQEEPKKTGLERVLEIAREVKNGDSPLAELREAKDNILALDFRKDKSKKH